MFKKNKVEVDYTSFKYESFEVGHLTSRTIKSMKIYMVVSAIYGFAELYNMSVLQNLYDSGYRGNVADIQSTTNDLFQAISALFSFCMFGVAAFYFLKWTVRANKAVRSMGAKGLTHSPGWAVGWYFVPIATLLLPFQAMSDLYKASVNPQNLNSIELPSIFRLWWALWVVSCVSGQIIFRYNAQHDDIQSIIEIIPFSVLADFMEVPLALTVIKIVQMVYNAQQQSLHGGNSTGSR